MTSRTISPIIAAILLLLATSFAAVKPGQSASLEYKVKAGFLINFARFINWPDSAFATPDTPFTIGLMGPDRFGNALDAASRKQAHGRPISVVRVNSIGEAKSCHLLYISDSDRTDMTVLLAQLGDRPIVTVGDMDNFAEEGGSIEFITRNGKLAFIINNTSTKKNGLKIPANLLNLAIDVL